VFWALLTRGHEGLLRSDNFLNAGARLSAHRLGDVYVCLAPARRWGAPAYATRARTN